MYRLVNDKPETAGKRFNLALWIAWAPDCPPSQRIIGDQLSCCFEALNETGPWAIAVVDEVLLDSVTTDFHRRTPSSRAKLDNT